MKDCVINSQSQGSSQQEYRSSLPASKRRQGVRVLSRKPRNRYAPQMLSIWTRFQPYYFVILLCLLVYLKKSNAQAGRWETPPTTPRTFIAGQELRRLIKTRQKRDEVMARRVHRAEKRLSTNVFNSCMTKSSLPSVRMAIE